MLTSAPTFVKCQLGKAPATLKFIGRGPYLPCMLFLLRSLQLTLPSAAAGRTDLGLSSSIRDKYTLKGSIKFSGDSRKLFWRTFLENQVEM
jgi:hypothetical protein